jgi:hypothetical protein
MTLKDDINLSTRKLFVETLQLQTGVSYLENSVGEYNPATATVDTTVTTHSLSGFLTNVKVVDSLATRSSPKTKVLQVEKRTVTFTPKVSDFIKIGSETWEIIEVISEMTDSITTFHIMLR